MNRGLWAAAGLMFVMTLLLNVPAAFVARFIPWSPGWQPAGISGTLWNGRMETLGLVGPVDWNLRPWFGQGQLNVGFQQRAWQLTFNGWPWAWQAQLLPGASRVTPATGYVLDGHWQGHVQLQGRGRHCMSSEGALQGQDVALLSPWMVVLGSARLNVECRDGVRLSVDVQREGEHHIQALVEPAVSRISLNGQVEPSAMVAPLLIKAGILKTGQTRFETVLGQR